MQAEHGEGMKWAVFEGHRHTTILGEFSMSYALPEYGALDGNHLAESYATHGLQ